ncbi:aminotransferase class IV [Xanthomonas albilineans]|uniref:Putative 4-amino-4-deoxychorismate lyase n=1 Tax=Xanthomonas albilineans TaxID=29447 RepID=Q70C35_XANAL|nr:aminotransferase class IV [Xanthomonas albilineans]CAE52331.1 putative 4-amino-4-deoxychorismate lyase [Xanthomonas albilineans]
MRPPRLRANQDGLLMDTAGRVVEGCTSNLFLVENGHLVTPDLGVAGVSGIMRGRVIEYGRQHGLACAVKHVYPDQLVRAQEVFLTNAVFGILLVRSIDAHSYRIDPVTLRLLDALCQGVYFTERSLHQVSTHAGQDP